MSNFSRLLDKFKNSFPEDLQSKVDVIENFVVNYIQENEIHVMRDSKGLEQETKLLFVLHSVWKPWGIFYIPYFTKSGMNNRLEI